MTHPACAGCPVLRNPVMLALPPAAREIASCRFRPSEVRSGAPLCLEGAPARSVFGLRRGTFKVVRSAAGGREQVQGAHHAGEVFGLESLVLKRYSCTLRAATAGVVCEAPRAVFVEDLRSTPTFGAAVLRAVCADLDRLRAELASLGTQPALARLARHLIEAPREPPEDGGPEQIVLPLSRRDTAGMLGMAEESLSRLITILEQRGILRRRGRRFLLDDAAALNRLAEA